MGSARASEWRPAANLCLRYSRFEILVCQPVFSIIWTSLSGAGLIGPVSAREEKIRPPRFATTAPAPRAASRRRHLEGAVPATPLQGSLQITAVSSGIDCACVGSACTRSKSITASFPATTSDLTIPSAPMRTAIGVPPALNILLTPPVSSTRIVERKPRATSSASSQIDTTTSATLACSSQRTR